MTSNSVIGLGKWLVKSCNDTNGYICHRNVGEFIFFSLLETIQCLKLNDGISNLHTCLTLKPHIGVLIVVGVQHVHALHVSGCSL